MFNNVTTYLRYKVNEYHTALINIASINSWDLENGRITKFYSTGSWIEKITDPNDTDISVRSLNATCPEEFFIQATMRGCLIDAPVIEDKDKEICRLKGIIHDLNHQLNNMKKKTDDLMFYMDQYKNLCNTISSVSDKIEDVTKEFS